MFRGTRQRVTDHRQRGRAVIVDTLAMTSTRLDGKRVLLTQARDFMGPALAEVFAAQGATLTTDDRALGHDPALPAAIAQNYVDNPTYFGPEVQAHPRFQDKLRREVPLGRLASAEEDGLFSAYLCSDAAACFVGQVFPVNGGWANR